MALSDDEYDDHICPPKESEYCPHGIYIKYECNDCDAEEHADRMHSYGN